MEASETIAQVVLNAATRALAATDNMPMSERVLNLYRDDAGAVAAAVLHALTAPKRGTARVSESDADGISKRQLEEIAGLLSNSP